jgi:hypothetical protein
VAADEDVDAGGIAPPHLQAVERGQRDLYRRVRGDRRRAGLRTGEIRDRARGPQAVLPHRPHGVLQPHECRIGPFECLPVDTVGVEAALDGIDLVAEAGEHVVGRHEERAVGEKRGDAGHAAQQVVDRLDVGRRRVQCRVEPVTSGERRRRRFEPPQDLLRRRRQAARLAPEHGDDSAHERRF